MNEYDRLVLEFQKDLNVMVNNNIFSYSDAKSLLDGAFRIETLLAKYELNLDKFILDALFGLIEKYIKLKNGFVLNHTTFKLSNLDFEIIKSVPQGGNWKNIPKEIIEKSKRLIQISKSGGRTTQYGRIDYKKPSYTITTYFNRPGNGTYVHPIHDRMISVREAARFQSFKDDYYFIGKQGDLLKQVGNAVPPFLAYLIAKKIKNRAQCKTSIDLFCGAGGLTSGFKEAGIKTVLGVDIDRNACLTLKVNNPEINVICDNITKPDVKEKIIKIAKENKIDIICAGPPCQGFSHAGKRDIDDPRNQLFIDLIEIVKRIRPRVVVIENVEGILTFLKGQFYSLIVHDISSLGYKVVGRLLLASEYAIPQKRKRVIIICVRDDLNIEPDSLFPDKITEDPSKQITAYEAIGDLENIPCGDDSIYNVEMDKLSSFVKMLQPPWLTWAGRLMLQMTKKAIAEEMIEL